MDWLLGSSAEVLVCDVMYVCACWLEAVVDAEAVTADL